MQEPEPLVQRQCGPAPEVTGACHRWGKEGGPGILGTEPRCPDESSSPDHPWVHRKHPSEFANSRRFGLEALYCPPGIRGAHEKGGVEGQVGWFRRNHLVPVPEVDTLAELNAMIDRWDQEDDARRIRSRPRTIGEYCAAEQSLLVPLPEEPFEAGRLSTPRVDRYSQICVRMNRY